MENPQVWAMVKDAAENLTGELTYADIRSYINSKYQNVNQATITAQIIVATVNHNSRTHYNENNNPRLSNSGSNFDLLYSLGRGKVVRYNSTQHGIWELYKNDLNKIKLRFVGVNTYLFAWNSQNWEFKELDELIWNIKNTGKATVIWSIASFKKVKIGDRAFIIQVGSKANGIFASGYIISVPQLLPHWSGEDKLVNRVTLELDVLLNPKTDQILSHLKLKNEVSDLQRWEPQSSGIQIRNEVTHKLEICWFNFLKDQDIFDGISSAEQIIFEGRSYNVVQTIYERNRYARALCLQHHGYTCKVCDFDFENFYGEVGKEFIHVHHLNQLSIAAKEHITNPILDLCPVCPNCHAMLHKNSPPYPIEELKARIESNKIASTTTHKTPLSI